MKCIFHKDRETTHYCQICKQTICRECSDLLGVVCISCAKREGKDEKRSFWITIVCSACLGLVGLIAMQELPPYAGMTGVFFSLFGMIGWAVAIPKGISMYKRHKVVEDIERNIKIIRGYPVQNIIK